MGRSKGQNIQTSIERIFQLISKLSGTRYYSVKELTEYFNCDENTIYRDKIIIENIGYDIERKDGKFKIKSYLDKNFKLGEAENKIVLSAIEAYKIPSTEKEIILKKLNHGNNILTPELLRIISQLDMIKTISYAIQQKRNIHIYQYQTTNPSSPLRDRIVIPLHYDENKQILQAYENNVVKNFRLSRMKGVDISEVMVDIDKKVKVHQIDPFGFAGELNNQIEFFMTDRATALISEEFPEVKTFIQSIVDPAFTHVIKVNVAGFEGIGRFVLGMMTEIKIIGDYHFKTYIQEKINKMTLLNS